MGFLDAKIDYENNKFIAVMNFSWLYLGVTTEKETFDSIEEAKDWILKKRCYDNLEITDNAYSSLSYADALRLQLSKRFPKTNKVIV